MPRLTLDAAAGDLAAIDLGEPHHVEQVGGYFDNGDLAVTSGNLYINIDGKEYGSLFFFQREDGTVTVSLGAFDPDAGEWVEKAELTGPIDFGRWPTT